MRTIAFLSFVYFLTAFVIGQTVVHDRDFWYGEAREALLRRLPEGRRPHARNVVLMVGDGMGVATLTAARLFRGQRQGELGEDTELTWDRFPAVALAKTYNMDAQIGESSACATALLCGVKANFETVGLDARGKFENCKSSISARVDSLIDWAHREGMMTGIVTNTRVSHATPAALFAHSPSRYWEDDSKVPPAARKLCKDITRQLVEDEPGRNINVILGGGRRHWLPKVTRDPEQTTDEGRRLDGRNLVEDWVRDKKKRGVKAEFVWNKQQLDNTSSDVDFLLGLFSYSHMEFEADRDTGPSGDPSLTDMTNKALSVLERSPKGYFLFVESGRIDHAHHYNNAYRALDETLTLETALADVLNRVDLEDTLIVVTTDHSHVLTLGGLATPRGNPILGTDTKPSDIDGQPYSTLLYGSGPGYSVPRNVPSNASSASEERNSVHGAAVPRQWGTHGGEDVPVFAAGPLARDLFSGIVDQSYIPHAIAFIACLGEHSKRCTSGPDNYTEPKKESCTSAHVSTVYNSRRRGGIVLASSVMSEDNPSSRASPPWPSLTSTKLAVLVLSWWILRWLELL
ncbi:alkaline phosphatase-like [Macrosteles quadrilineatus]|uniref:alkaline phosphatase-like n=1 Tax=Macrosteles quadrilineatus TaxID=74068 RepID=UPI0023E216D2|nr:alkaline phosphatase-like [Macrosteles quadrilineatus]XP_054280853.1 alkaline phosphatase-like [Macrosteles quadrilineatus]